MENSTVRLSKGQFGNMYRRVKFLYPCNAMACSKFTLQKLLDKCVKMILQHYLLQGETVNDYYPFAWDNINWSRPQMLLVCGPHSDLQDPRSSLPHIPRCVTLWISARLTFYPALGCATPPWAGGLTSSASGDDGWGWSRRCCWSCACHLGTPAPTGYGAPPGAGPRA